MKKHTPGPWVIGNGRCIYGSGDLVIPFIASVEDDHNDSETAANARLIASAPDLLASLIECERIADELFQETGLHEYMHASDRAREAIAKATGGEA